MWAWCARNQFAKATGNRDSLKNWATSGDSKGGPGEAMAPPDFLLALCLAPPVFFLIHRSSSFGWHRSYTYTVDNFVAPPTFSLAPQWPTFFFLILEIATFLILESPLWATGSNLTTKLFRILQTNILYRGKIMNFQKSKISSELKVGLSTRATQPVLLKLMHNHSNFHKVLH